MSFMGGPSGTAAGLKGTGYNQVSLNNFTPEQQQLFKQQFGRLGPDSYLSRLAGGDESTFQQLEAPAMRQFGELQGQIASRFSGAGMGGRRSSGFNLSQSSAAQEFAEKLQAQRMGLQQQALRDLHGMSMDLLNQRPYENVLLEEKLPFWKQLLLGSSGGLGQGLGTGLGGGFLKLLGLG